MKLDEYESWNEVISKEQFSFLINELILKENNYSNSEILERLEILSEKYLKFYDLDYLTKIQRQNVNKILIKLTDFSNLTTIEELIGVLFNLKIDEYYHYLKRHSDTIISKQVEKEVFESLKEYEETLKQV